MILVMVRSIWGYHRGDFSQGFGGEGHGVNLWSRFWSRFEVDGRGSGESGVRGQSAVVGMSHARISPGPGWT